MITPNLLLSWTTASVLLAVPLFAHATEPAEPSTASSTSTGADVRLLVGLSDTCPASPRLEAALERLPDDTRLEIVPFDEATAEEQAMLLELDVRRYAAPQAVVMRDERPVIIVGGASSKPEAVDAVLSNLERIGLGQPSKVEYLGKLKPKNARMFRTQGTRPPAFVFGELEGVDLLDADFGDKVLGGCSFVGSSLLGVDFDGALISASSFCGATMNEGAFEEASLVNSVCPDGTAADPETKCDGRMEPVDAQACPPLWGGGVRGKD